MATPLNYSLRLSVMLAAMALIGAIATTSSGVAAGNTTKRVSVDSSENQANGNSIRPSISSSGDFIAFSSEASDLVRNDTNRDRDVFLRKTEKGTTERVSVNSSGRQGNGTSRYPSITPFGHLVAFESNATNLVANDTNNRFDVFVHNHHTGTTKRVSVDSSGNQGNSSSTRPSFSSDGSFLAFDSLASNLVENDTNGKRDVFVHNRSTGTTERVSVNSSGRQANGTSRSPSISYDGNFVAFESNASNLVEGDTNNAYDIFVHDRSTGETELVSVNSSGRQANDSSDNASISSDGTFVAFSSEASNLVRNDANGERDIFVRNTRTGTTERVSVNSLGRQANGTSRSPSISEDGRYVAFDSSATNLVSNDTNNSYDVFVHDRRLGTTRRVSVNSSGNQANSSSDNASIGFDGNVIAFASRAQNLVANDTNNVYDVFVYGRDTTTP